MQLVQFCNYIVSSNTDDSSTNIVTLLIGDSWDEKKKQATLNGATNTLNFQGILESIQVKSENIVQFFAKYKKK